VFYDKIFLLVARNALIARQSISLSGTAAANQFAAGAFPESVNLPTGFTLTRPNINIADPQIELPYNHQVNIGVERQIGTHWAAGANFIYVRGENLLRSDNTNLGPPTVLTAANAASLGVAGPSPQQIGRPFYGTTNRLDPAFNNIQEVSASSRSRYKGLQLVLQKRMSHGFELRANYTLSEAKDDSSDFTQAEQPNDPYNRGGEFSYSAEHQKHRFTLAGVHPGDLLLELNGERVDKLTDYLRKLWRATQPGREVTLTLGREGDLLNLRLRAANRNDFLKKPSLH